MVRRHVSWQEAWHWFVKPDPYGDTARNGERSLVWRGRRIIASKDEEWYGDEELNHFEVLVKVAAKSGAMLAREMLVVELRIPQTKLFKVKRRGCDVRIWLDYRFEGLFG